MQKSARLALAAAAAALLTAGSAFAQGTFTPEIGLGQDTGKHVLQGNGRGHAHDPAFNVAFGYELDNGIGARVMAIGDFDVAKDLLPTQRSFDNFVGVEATGKVALADRFNLRGGLGVGRSKLDGDKAGRQLVSDGVVSVGLQWRPVDHYAMEVRVDHLTTSGTTMFGLQFQVPF